MHTAIVRIQNVFGFFTTVAFAVAALIAFSDILAPRTPKATVSMRDVQMYAIPSSNALPHPLHSNSNFPPLYPKI
jgi:hypothetical protein